MHSHPDEELGASGWPSLDALLVHFQYDHGMLIGPVGKTLDQLARVHAGEHDRDIPLDEQTAYDSAPPRGSELTWTRVYRRGGRYAHLREESGGLIACPVWRNREHGTEDGWLGTGSQAEYDKAGGMPTCPGCFRVREASYGIEGHNPARGR